VILRLHAPNEGRARAEAGPEDQPMPIEFRTCHAEDGRFTAIFREWEPGESGPGGSCRRCLSCSAYDNRCLMMVPGIVPRSEAAAYSVVDRGQVVIRSRAPRPR
jgi:hypothetical protein